MEQPKKMAVWWAVLLFLQELKGSQLASQGEVKHGPKSGIVIRDASGLLLTEHKLISQLLFLELDPQLANEKSYRISKHDREEFKEWYSNHLEKTRGTTKEILRHLRKMFVSPEQMPKHRSKGFVGLLVGGIIVTVVGAVVGLTISIASSVSLAAVNAKTEALRSSLATTQAFLAAQDMLNEDLIQTVNQTVLRQNSHAQPIIRMTRLHEKNINTKKNFYYSINPIIYVTQHFLREAQFNVRSLIRASILLYFVSTEDVRTILNQLHYLVVNEMQLSVALEMGSAVPMFVDPEKLQLSFLLNLPLVLPEKIYNTKQVLNVGAWKGEQYLKVRMPSMIDYQPWNNGTYLVPKLDTCSVFKDLNYLCPSKPFFPEFSIIGCGVNHPKDNLNVCEVTLSHPDPFSFNTVAVLVDRQWLVSTVLTNKTVTYEVHGMFKVMSLGYRVSLITVYKDVIITIGNKALFYVSSEDVQKDIELIYVLNNDHLLVDPDLEYLLKNKLNHTLQFTVRKANVSVEKSLYDRRDVIMLQEKDWLIVKVYSMFLCIGVLLVWMFIISINVYCNSHQRQYSGLSKQSDQPFKDVTLEQIQITED